MVELKPCKLCGGSLERYVGYIDTIFGDRECVGIRCSSCHASTSRYMAEEVDKHIIEQIEDLWESGCISKVEYAEVPCRCKDCKYWKHFDYAGCSDYAKVCTLANYMIGANGFCLYGERRD